MDGGERWIAIYTVLGATAFALSACLTWLLIRVAPRVGLVDEPSATKFHRVATPVGGGVAIYLALLPLLLVPATQSRSALLILVGSGLLAAVGLWDDFSHVSAVVKLCILIGLTTLLWLSGVSATTTRIALLDLAITILWMTGVSSAFNAIDNMDGLAPGVAAIAAGAFLVIALQTEQWVLGGLSAALIGASLGFLLFNFHPARVFMGDSGSFFLGFFLASLGVVGDWNSNELIAAIIPILVLGLPIFDLTFTVTRRHMSGITRTAGDALRHCDTDHVSHRLVRIGLGTRGAVVFLYLIAASFGISAITLRNAAETDGLLHLLQALVIVAALIPILCLGERRPALPPAAGPAPAARPSARSLGRWLVLAAVALAAHAVLRAL